MAALDKLLCNNGFEQKYPLAFVIAKSRARSDHVPLLIDFGTENVKKPTLFRFEKWWLEQLDFKHFVSKIWSTECAYQDALDIWQFKIRLLRKKVKRWAININAEIKRKKIELLKEFDNLDAKYEAGILLPGEQKKMDDIMRDLEKYLEFRRD